MALSSAKGLVLIGLVIVYAILSWVQSDSPLVDVIDRLCAPLLRPFRKHIPLVGGIDLSPLALLVAAGAPLVIVVMRGREGSGGERDEGKHRAAMAAR